MVQGSLRLPETHSEHMQGQNNAHDNTKILLAFFTLTFSHMQSVLFQRVQDISQYAKAELWIQFFLLTQTLKRFAKCKYHSSH